MSNGRRILAAVLVGVGALVYGISPVDIIPELIAGPFGFADDLAVLAGGGLRDLEAAQRAQSGQGPGDAAARGLTRQ